PAHPSTELGKPKRRRLPSLHILGNERRLDWNAHGVLAAPVPGHRCGRLRGDCRIFSVIHTIWIHANLAWRFSIKEPWYYALSLFCLVDGSACGEIMALGHLPESYGYVRLAHIHPPGGDRLCSLGHHRDAAPASAGGLEPSTREPHACPDRNDLDTDRRDRLDRWILKFIDPD